MLACLRWSEIHEAAFVTLTFHEVPDDWMADFRAFLQRLRRAGTKYIWRLELQKRGAPHFHLMVFPAEKSEIPLDDLRAAWHAIAAHGSRAHLQYGWHQRKIDSFRAARAYLSKYVAKLDPRENSHVEGRRVWGASRDLPLDPQFVADVSRKNFFTLRRIARRLLRARARARGSSWKPFTRSGMWVYLDARWSLELLAFLGVRTVWKDSGRELLPGST